MDVLVQACVWPAATCSVANGGLSGLLFGRSVVIPGGGLCASRRLVVTPQPC